MNAGASRRWLAALSVAAVTLSCGALSATAQAAPSGGVLATGVAAAADTGAAAVPGVTVRPDPSYAGKAFEGWGTSLVWFANATGDYPDEVRDKLADMVFGDEGLNLNIARYNVGGGHAPDVTDYLRAGGAVEGWWNAPEGTTRTDVDWWDPEDPADWNEDADATQRWWVDRIKDDVDTWETFSNSPPYFMTPNGYVSGSFNATDDQLKTESIDDFAAYMVGVTERLEKAHGIEVGTIDPFNEPNTNYWRTTLNSAGEPTGGRQEGAHMGPALQQKVITALDAALEGADTSAGIAAMDETNPGTFTTNWNSYPADVKAKVDQLNVHTYGTGQRTAVRDIAKGEGKRLWMSEVGGSWSSTGQDFVSMESGLGSAQHIADDLRELEPSAWVFWQPVEDYTNMAPGGESAEGANWGEIQIPFDCTAEDTLETCPIYTNTKYQTTQNFTHFIAPGDHLVGVDDTNSTAAVAASGDAATVVHVNSTTAERAVTLDLSGFGSIEAGATVTPFVTSTAGTLVEGTPVAVASGAATLTVPAESVTTFVVDGVAGVAQDASLVQEGHVYRLQGVQSGRSLAPAASGSGVVIRTNDAAASAQVWELTPLGTPEGSGSHTTRYAVTSAANGKQLAVVPDGTAVLVDAATQPATTAQWILSTTGDRTYTLVNAASGRVLEVGGQSSTDGAPVSTYTANSGQNQRWRLTDETVLSTTPVEAFTVPGTVPTLPTTVVPVYRDGARGTLPVTWDLPAESAWAAAGTVEVQGTVTTPGGPVTATAEVVVDTLTTTLPARAKAYAGGTPVLPATVPALTAGGRQVERPVTWETAPAGAFAEVGVVELAGTADSGLGEVLPATVRVQVTAAVDEGATSAPGTTASATFTEPGYSASGIVNGNTTDKAWSNWKSSDKNATDTLTVTLPASRDVTHVVTTFYRDGSTASWAQDLRVQALVDGAWKDVSASVAVSNDTSRAPVVDVPVDVRTSAVRVVMTARPNTHMVVSEVQVLAKAPGTSSDAALSGLTVDGEAVAGFDPATTSYQVLTEAGATPVVAAVAADPYATVAVRQPGEVTAGSTATATVDVTAEDGTTSTTTIAFVTQVDLGVESSVRAQCTGRTATLSVRAVNTSDVPLDVVVTTPLGTKTFQGVAPGKSASQTFSARAQTLTAGTTTVTATRTDGTTHTQRIDHPATTC
ncbi:RICIN domain-containing protein [Oerskovia enterophila]